MASDSKDPLLTYSQAVTPTPFLAGATLAEVAVIATVPENVDCTKLVFDLPVGTGQEALFTPEAWNAVLGSKPLEGDWTLEKDKSVKGRFTATTTSKPHGDFSFRFKQITVGAQHGPAKIALTETSAPTGQSPVERGSSVTVQKVSTAVKFTDLKAAPSNVPCGEQVTVSWKGPGDAAYTVYYGLDQQAPPPKQQSGVWSTTVTGITCPTTFVVKAEGTDGGGQTVRSYQSVHVTVTKPKVTAGDLHVQTSTNLFGTPRKHTQDWSKGAFVAIAPTDGFLLYQPTHSVGGQRTSRVFANVYTDAQLSHVQRRTVRRTGEKPQTPSAICLPVPAGSKIELTALTKPDTGTVHWIPLGGKGLSVSAQATDAAAPSAGPFPRLRFAYAPHAVDTSTNEQPSKTTVVLYVDAVNPQETLTKLRITLPVGQKAEDLTGSLSGIDREYTRWSGFDETNGYFEADPGEGSLFRSTPETLKLKDVTVNKATGRAEIEIREDRGGTLSEPVRLPVAKGGPQLKMSDLRALPPVVKRGGAARVTWKANVLTDVRYELVWSGGKQDVSTVNEHTVKGIRRTTSVTLTAYDKKNNDKVLHSLSTSVTVSDPDLTAKTLKVDGVCSLIRSRQTWSPTFVQEWKATAGTDGLLVLSAINTRPGAALSGDERDAKVRAKNEPVTLACKVTPAGGGSSYSARSLAYDPQETYGDLLPVGMVIPVARGASVSLTRTPGNSYAIDSLLTWLPFGTGQLVPSGPGAGDDLPLAAVATAGGDEEVADTVPDDRARRLISGFRPDTVNIPHTASVTLSWVVDEPGTVLTLVHHNARGEVVTVPVTGRSEQVVRNLKKDTAFVLIATEGAFGTGKILEVATTTVTVANPDADFTDLTVTGNTTMMGPPVPVNYTFTSDYTKSDVPTDGFLAGHISDDSAAGSKVAVTVTPKSGSPYGATLYSAKSADGQTTVPDPVFLPVPKGATLHIAASAAHLAGADAVESRQTGGAQASLVWIPLAAGAK